jgi:sulfite exporter TauE/SafE
MDPIHTTLGALTAGLVTSVHCVGMCGPIACGLSSLPSTETKRQLAIIAYHASRLTSYALVGAACGAIGQQPLKWFFGSPAVLLPWILVALMVIFGLGLEKKLPRPPALLRLATRLRFKFSRLSPISGGAAMGFLTPLLPCGPLYLLFGASLLTGSAIRGAEFALAFGLGTVPLLWLAQHQLRHLQRRLTPATLTNVKRVLALTAAVILAFRLHGTLPFSSPAPETELPACCH